MSVLRSENLDLFFVEETLCVLSKNIQQSYNFDFQKYFRCQSPEKLPDSCMVISRAGPRVYYKLFYEDLLKDGIELIHNPETHQLCTALPEWYPYIPDLTPQSRWFDEVPDVETIIDNFGFPVFIRGAKKTKYHSKQLSIIENADDYARVQQVYTNDPVLGQQQFICREFIPLRKVADVDGDSIPASFEFRTFWWRGHLVGSGRYWMNVPSYDWTENEKVDAIAVAKRAAAALPVPFLVVDVGQQIDGQWIVIEVNDAQDCGYADIPPEELWQNIIHIERNYIDNNN